MPLKRPRGRSSNYLVVSLYLDMNVLKKEIINTHPTDTPTYCQPCMAPHAKKFFWSLGDGDPRRTGKEPPLEVNDVRLFKRSL
jgi:hypothetical protein